MAYNPIDHIAQNKPFGTSDKPLDGKLMFYDKFFFKYRPFISTAEVLSYFPSMFRRGNFDILINTGGTLNNGVVTGGTNSIWWFGNGIADSDLVQKISNVNLSNYYTKSESNTRFVSLTGSYANPTWITSLDYSKITNVPPVLINLESVTSGLGNNTTSNSIQITGAESFDSTSDGTWLIDGGLAKVSGSIITGTLSFETNEIQLSHTTGSTVNSSLSLKVQTASISGAMFTTRVSGENALLNNDFTTLGQVNSLISAIPTISANNGLTKTGSNIQLGGSIDNITVIGTELANKSTISIGDNRIATTVYGSFLNRYAQVETFTGAVMSTSIKAAEGSTFRQIKIEGSSSGNMIVEDLNSINSRGLINAGDYEANFVPRSLVTKQYVDGAISGIPPVDLSGYQLRSEKGQADGYPTLDNLSRAVVPAGFIGGTGSPINNTLFSGSQTYTDVTSPAALRAVTTTNAIASDRLSNNGSFGGVFSSNVGTTNTKNWHDPSFDPTISGTYSGITGVQVNYGIQPGAIGNIDKVIGVGIGGALIRGMDVYKHVGIEVHQPITATGGTILYNVGISTNQYIAGTHNTRLLLGRLQPVDGNWSIYSDGNYNNYLGIGNTLINSIIDNGAKLQVTGTATVSSPPTDPTGIVRLSDLGSYQLKSEEGQPNGYASLGSDGKVPNSQIPALAISETFPVTSEAEMLALSQAEQGDVAIRSDVNKSYILQQSPPSTLSNWLELLTPTAAVQSVFGRVGNVSAQVGDYSSFYPLLNGTGATGTWSIDINGTARVWGGLTADFSGGLSTNPLNHIIGHTTGSGAAEMFDVSAIGTALGIPVVINLQSVTDIGNVTTNNITVNTTYSQIGSFLTSGGGIRRDTDGNIGLFNSDGISEPLIKGSYNGNTVLAPARNDSNNLGDVTVEGGGQEIAIFDSGAKRLSIGLNGTYKGQFPDIGLLTNKKVVALGNRSIEAYGTMNAFGPNGSINGYEISTTSRPSVSGLGSVTQWILGKSYTEENDFWLARADNDGNIIDYPLQIERSTGEATFTKDLTAPRLIGSADMWNGAQNDFTTQDNAPNVPVILSTDGIMRYTSWTVIRDKLDLSGYVNTTTNQTGIAGNKTWSGIGTFTEDGNVKTVIYPGQVQTLNSSTVKAILDGFSLTLYNGAKIGSFRPPTVDGSFLYTMPGATGVLALTSQLTDFVDKTNNQAGIGGVKTWTGENTWSNHVNFTGASSLFSATGLQANLSYSSGVRFSNPLGGHAMILHDSMSGTKMRGRLVLNKYDAGNTSGWGIVPPTNDNNGGTYELPPVLGATETLAVRSDIGTGWGQYSDNLYTSGSPLIVNASVTTTITNNATTIINSQLPDDVISFYDPTTSKITPSLNGDSYLINVRFTAQSSSNTGLADIELVVTGAVGILPKQTISMRKGAGSTQQINIIFDVFSASAFVTNGGLIRLTSIDGNTTIYDISFKITRTHKAR